MKKQKDRGRQVSTKEKCPLRLYSILCAAVKGSLRLIETSGGMTYSFGLSLSLACPRIDAYRIINAFW